MQLSTRFIRLVAAATTVGCAAVALPATALAAPSHAGQAGGVSRVGHARQTGRLSQCRSSNTTIWLGLGNGGGSAGTIFYPVEFSNTGRRTCTLFGYPGISAVSISGRQIGRPASHSGRRRVVLLRPGGTAHVILGIVEAGNIAGCRIRRGASLKIFAPGQAAATVIPNFTFTACANKSVLVVDAVHQGTGIPGFTTS